MSTPLIGCRWDLPREYLPERETLSELSKRENGFRLWESSKFARALRKAFDRMVRRG